MASDIDICNLALSHLGNEANIAGFDERSVEAENCKRYYPIVRGIVQESMDWNFNTRRVALALLSTTPPAEWNLVYQVPSDCLRVLSIQLPPEAPNAALFNLVMQTAQPKSTAAGLEEPFIQEVDSNGARVIYTNAEDAIARYSFLQTNTARYPTLVVFAMSRLLASMLAGPILKGEAGMKVATAQLGIYTKVNLPNAMAADANAQNFEQVVDFVPVGIAARL